MIFWLFIKAICCKFAANPAPVLIQKLSENILLLTLETFFDKMPKKAPFEGICSNQSVVIFHTQFDQCCNSNSSAQVYVPVPGFPKENRTLRIVKIFIERGPCHSVK